MGLRRTFALRGAAGGPLILAVLAAVGRSTVRAVASIAAVGFLGFLLAAALGPAIGDVRDFQPGSTTSLDTADDDAARPLFFSTTPEDGPTWTRLRLAAVEEAAERAGRRVAAAARARGTEELTADSIVHLLVERALDGRIEGVEALVGVAPDLREAVGTARSEIKAVARDLRKLVARGAATIEAAGAPPNPVVAPYAATTRGLVTARAATRPKLPPDALSKLRSAIDAKDAPAVAAALLVLRTCSDAPDLGSARVRPGEDASAEDVAKDAAFVRRAERWLRREGDRYRTFDGAFDRWSSAFARSRFGVWVGDLAARDLGDSTGVRPGASVSALLIERLPRTAAIVAPSLLLLFLLAAPLGVRAARRIGGTFDRALLYVFGLLHAAPEFWTGTLVVMYLAGPGAGLLPAAGLFDATSEAALAGGASVFEPAIFFDLLRHLAAPVCVLSAPALLVVARHARAAAADASAAPWCDAAILRGAAPGEMRSRLGRHAAAPMAAMFGASLPALIGGSVLVETMFDIPGAARLAADAALMRDAPVATALLLLGAAASIFGRWIGDFAQAILDPRTAEDLR